jgi:hypothetical protein
MGLMLLWDGSRHDWLEGRGPWLCLLGAIDDATGDVLPGAHFLEQECAAGYLQVLQAIVATRGRPWSIYMDRHGALKRNDDHGTFAEERRGAQDPTQVRRALAALGIEALYALSPQAKGRVERLWGTLQDRLVSELRLAGATTAAAANRVLAAYRPAHNARFGIAARDRTPAWRPRRRGQDLARLCSVRYEATVLKDNTVRLGGHVIDVPPGPRGRSIAAIASIRQGITTLSPVKMLKQRPEPSRWSAPGRWCRPSRARAPRRRASRRSGPASARDRRSPRSRGRGTSPASAR